MTTDNVTSIDASKPPDRVTDIQLALDNPNKAIAVMRIACGNFEDGGAPHFDGASATDLHAGLGQAFDHLEIASDSIEGLPGPIREALWDSADVVSCVIAALAHEKIPDSAGMTECPVRGALRVAISKLEELVSDISAFLAAAKVETEEVAHV
jgi:hypothetical protein